MATIRKTLETFIYPFLENFTDMVFRGGEDTEFQGVRVLDDDIKFTQGALVNAAATLYAHYVKTNDTRADDVLDRLHYFIALAAGSVCKTWGKVAVLRGFNTLFEAGLFEKVKPEYIELVKERTNYEDFFDKEKMDTRDMATNYIQVAMFCAGMREKFGWECDGYAERIRQKLISVMQDKTVGGWMDDAIPYGRFDRYSLVLSSEFIDTARLAGLEVPQFVKDNQRLAVEAMLFIANREGCGISYGRSVSIHGDGTVVEVLSSAFAEGLIKKSEQPLALAYSLRIIQKTISFWYNGEKGCFDMWWGGRGHDEYRPIDRILETNLDIANHLYMYLKNFELAGVADVEIDYDIPEYKEWKIYELDFVKDNDKVRKAVFMRRENRLVMLPFVAFGSPYGVHSAYFPFPSVSGGVLEGAPTARYAFLVPEYTDRSGDKFLPVQHYSHVEVTKDGDTVRIQAEGYLAKREGIDSLKTDKRFSIDYRFSGADISVRFRTNEDMNYAEMITGDSGRGVSISSVGFESCEDVDTTGRDDYCATHGPILNAKLHRTKNTKLLGYNIKI